jgi:hypothetical protein
MGRTTKEKVEMNFAPKIRNIAKGIPKKSRKEVSDFEDVSNFRVASKKVDFDAYKTR